ncbi:unnamed protein product [Leuciscus chuanchicus]
MKAARPAASSTRPAEVLLQQRGFFSDPAIISLSLPLEVEYQDNNTYSCVIYNPISNQTTHLDNNKLCHTAGISVLSSISVSDLSISLSLPLEIQCLDDSYSCVVSYSFTNKTQHLNNTDLCHTCPDLTITESEYPQIIYCLQTGGLPQVYEMSVDELQVYEMSVDELQVYVQSVPARLPFPVITSNSSNCSSSSSSSESRCSLVCSVLNVSDVTLSWYKGISVLSSISVSDLSISLSLPLEIQCLDDSYSCVVSYSFTNKTQHLNNTDLCQPCPALTRRSSFMMVIAVTLALLAAIAVVGDLTITESEYTQIIYCLQMGDLPQPQFLFSADRSDAGVCLLLL